MNKKAIVFFCIFLAALFVIAACKRTSPYGLVVTDREGMEHVVMTDANGVTVVDSLGNLVEIMTDSGNKKPIAAPTDNGTTYAGQVGEYETHAITFPGIIQNGDQLEDKDCTLTLPEGWEQTGKSMMILKHKETGATISIYPNIDDSLTNALDRMEQGQAKMSLDHDIKSSRKTIDGVSAYCMQYDLGEIQQINYLLQKEVGKICRINCTVPTDQVSAVDLDAVLQTIHFK